MRPARQQPQTPRRIAGASVLALLLAACGAPPERSAGGFEHGMDSASTANRPAAPRTPAMQPARATSRRGYLDYPEVDQLIDRLSREQGFERRYLEGLFAQVERQQWILDFLDRSSTPSRGPTGAWTRYRAKFLTADNIANGVAFWQREAAALASAERRYGVPAEYIVAILGVETRYGGYMGKHRVIDALATLAFDYPRRAEYFTGELTAFLIMARDEGLDPLRPRGSYAGAMGLGQFMPTSFQRFAVDLDGNGRRDLWDPQDAIGSVANYFKSHGWRTGEGVTVAVRGAAGASGLKNGFDTRYRVGALRAQGLAPAGTLGDDEEVSLLRLDAQGGYEYWLGRKNFYVITRYNHSTYYAMAVHQLAQAIRARRTTQARADGPG